MSGFNIEEYLKYVSRCSSLDFLYSRCRNTVLTDRQGRKTRKIKFNNTAMSHKKTVISVYNMFIGLVMDDLLSGRHDILLPSKSAVRLRLVHHTNKNAVSRICKSKRYGDIDLLKTEFSIYTPAITISNSKITKTLHITIKNKKKMMDFSSKMGDESFYKNITTKTVLDYIDLIQAKYSGLSAKSIKNIIYSMSINVVSALLFRLYVVFKNRDFHYCIGVPPNKKGSYNEMMKVLFLNKMGEYEYDGQYCYIVSYPGSGPEKHLSDGCIHALRSFEAAKEFRCRDIYRYKLPENPRNFIYTKIHNYDPADAEFVFGWVKH